MSNSPPMSHGSRNGRILFIATGCLTLLVHAPGCTPDVEPLPELPGVKTPDGADPGKTVWFWRDVLAAPLPDEPLPRLELLGREPPAAILDALAELSDQKDPAAMTTLMAALRHEQEAVACAAARELGTRNERAALPRLLKSIGPFPVDYDVPITVRAASASALARMGNPAGIPLILATLSEGTDLESPRPRLPWTPTTRMAFVQELALEGLVALAGNDFGFDPDGSIPSRTEAAARANDWWDENRTRLWMASGPLDDPGLVTRIRLLVAHLRTYQLRQIDGAVFTLRNLGPDALPYLIEGLRSDDAYVRLHVLDVLTHLADDVDRKTCNRLAVLAAQPLLEDPSPAIAARAAGVCGAARVADPLVNALERRREPEVRLAVIDALGATGLPTALDMLVEWSVTEDARTAPPEQLVALEASLLELDTSRSPDAFLALLAHEDAAVSYPAVERLIAMTGADQGLDVTQAPADRVAAVERARAALSSR